MLIPCFSWGLGSKIPCENRKSANKFTASLHRQNNVLIFSLVFLLHQYCEGSCFPFYYYYYYYSPPWTLCSVAWRPVEMSHNFDNTINWRIRVTYFYLLNDPPIFETTQQEPAKSEGWLHLIKSVWHILCFIELIWDLLGDLIWCSECTSLHTPELEWLGVTTECYSKVHKGFNYLFIYLFLFSSHRSLKMIMDMSRNDNRSNNTWNFKDIYNLQT